MARTKRAGQKSKKTTTEDYPKARLSLAIKPTNTTSSNSNLTTVDQSLSNHTRNDTVPSTLPLAVVDMIIGNNGNSASASRTVELNVVQSSSDKSESPSTSAKEKKTKPKTKATTTDPEFNLNHDNRHESDAQYDLHTSIEESGGIDRFLNTPSMILYKKNLKNQCKFLIHYIFDVLTIFEENNRLTFFV
ncbi:unnamed protein product [Adineta ricciae]|uniref:Uncharacterized protein n=1 Tax=Adineta ricciae TaxID=249248 RepID=A0A815VGV5_ADIRI|nr:unnamed protein product [Adineta ricciae]CAF1532750.1 unnamed protein product [Adineta ricciae]